MQVIYFLLSFKIPRKANMKAPKTTAVFGQPSWTLESGSVTASLTQTGGHLAPVAFHLGRKTVQPFSIAPWWNEKVE